MSNLAHSGPFFATFFFIIRNMKFISSIIYHAIMELFDEELEEVFVLDNEEKIRNIGPADPLFAPGIYWTILSSEP